MAYLNFPHLGGATVLAASSVTPKADPCPAPAERLTALEWSVVDLARRDGPATLRRPGRLTRLLRAILKQPNPTLADGRLEALRRIAVLTWRQGYTVPSREVAAFLGAGFTAGQYETMVDRIAGIRLARRRTAAA